MAGPYSRTYSRDTPGPDSPRLPVKQSVTGNDDGGLVRSRSGKDLFQVLWIGYDEEEDEADLLLAACGGGHPGLTG